MQVINWLALQPLLEDVDTLNARLQESQPLRKVYQFMVDITLHGYPWRGRSDLIPCYHPSRTYNQGQWIALPVPDPQERRPTAWQVAQVKYAERTGNSVQGRFQALILDVSGKEVQKTAGITGASYPEPGLTGYTSEQLGWLTEWVADTYAGALLATLKKLMRKGRVGGQLAGETFLPEQLFALSVERLHPFFERLSPALRWVSIEEILQGLPDLSHLKRETAMALVRSTLKVSPFRPLGGDRWTTPDLFDQLDREVTYGLPAALIRSKAPVWTEQDKKDLADPRKRSIPAEAVCALEELGTVEIRSEPEPAPWQPPDGLIRLPVLNYHHIAQAYFPVGQAMHAFAPDLQMVFVQFMEGDYQPFFLEREQGLLKAVHPEGLRAQILEAGIPAGTYLWLAYQGDEKYRIFPQLLSTPRLVPGKRVSLENGNLLIEHSQIQVDYICGPTVFKADLCFEAIETLFDEARHGHLSLRDAMISAIQELCAVDPYRAAHRMDIFNAVFLKRVCSPSSVSILLYTQPCFIQLDGNYFRYRPLPDAPEVNIWKTTNRISRLWEDLAAIRLAPDPVTRGRISQRAYAEMDRPLSPDPDPGLPILLELPQMEAELPVRSPVFDCGEEIVTEEKPFIEKASLETIHLVQQVRDLFTPPENRPEADRSQAEEPGEPTNTHAELEPASLPVLSTVSSAPHTAFIKVSMEPDLQPASTIDTRRIAYGLKVPARPLHKRPIYQRVFFCLRGWIHMISEKSHDRYPR